jgi:non-homologous end joining protein Ku
MQTVWKGSISFRLVSKPIRLASATQERSMPSATLPTVSASSIAVFAGHPLCQPTAAYRR